MDPKREDFASVARKAKPGKSHALTAGEVHGEDVRWTYPTKVMFMSIDIVFAGKLDGIPLKCARLWSLARDWVTAAAALASMSQLQLLSKLAVGNTLCEASCGDYDHVHSYSHGR